MLRDGFLDLPSQSGFDDEFPAHITEVAAGGGEKRPAQMGRNRLRVTCGCHTLRSIVSALFKGNPTFTPLPSCGDIPILSESVCRNLWTWVATESSSKMGQRTWTVLPPFLSHQMAEFRRTIAGMLWTVDVDRHLT